MGPVDVLTCDNVREAEDLIYTIPSLDLACVDLLLPLGSGRDVAKVIKAEFPHAPIAIMTGLYDQTFRRTPEFHGLLQIGVNAVVAKNSLTHKRWIEFWLYAAMNPDEIGWA